MPGTRRPRASYAAVAGAGAPKQPIILPTLQYKHIPMRHKRKIIVVQGTESIQQKNQLYKELIEQLNASGARAGTRAGAGARDTVAIRQLPRGDIVLTMADEKACTSWLVD